MRARIIILSLFINGLLLASSPFYGVQTHFGQYRRADMDSLSMELQLDLVQEAGIEMIRDECLWSDVEIDSGVYNIPSEVDRYVRSALDRGIDVYMILNYNNTIYAESNGSGVTTEENRNAYARYCQAVVSYFSPLGVKHYEIWNEPNHGVLFWTPQPNANDYTSLLHTAYDSIKAIDSTVTVIGCATSPAIGNGPPYIEGLDFIRDVFAAGGGDYMDAVSFHLYQVAYKPEYELRSYVNSIKSYVDDMPIYFSEFGYPTHDGWPNISLERQALNVTRMYLICAMDPQIKSVVHYDLKNDGTVAEEPEHNFGLLQFNLTPKPAYEALKYLINSTNAKQPISNTLEDDIFNLKISDTLQISWSYSGNKTAELNFDAHYIRVEGMTGDTLQFHITANDTIHIDADEEPKYCYVQESEPSISKLEFEHKEYLLYPGESFKCIYSAELLNGLPVIIDPSAVNWSLSGSSGLLNNDHFTAQSPGSGMIIAEIQQKKDTINFTVMQDPSYYTAEDFSDTSGFTLVSTNLNMEASHLGHANGNEWDALTLDYEYSGTSATAYLYKDILINHFSDSIFMDFKTDDKIYEFRVYCKDGNGVSHTLGLRPKPTDWLNSWGTLGGPMTIDETTVPPIKVEKIYIKLKPGETTQTSPFSGTIMFDNFRIKKGDAVGIVNETSLPNLIYLNQNYPNPFNSKTRIHFTLNYSASVRIIIYDLKGNLIKTILDSHLDAGDHIVDLKINNLASGVYIYRLVSDKQSISKKLVYMK